MAELSPAAGQGHQAVTGIHRGVWGPQAGDHQEKWRGRGETSTGHPFLGNRNSFKPPFLFTLIKPNHIAIKKEE